MAKTQIDYSDLSFEQEMKYRLEDAAMVKRIHEEFNTRKIMNAYHDLLDLLDFIAKNNGNLYLTDEGIDNENVMADKSIVHGTAQYWLAMDCAARMSAGFRAEDAGIDLNKLAGKTIY